ncbi:MAG: hypothetical protein PUP90_24730 [Nostoc sp. S4]|nr:hypothetical protein [Nostoc sp. S4]
MMNRHLQPKGITAKVAFKDAYLEVILESTEVPNQQTLVAFVRKGLTKLGAVSVEKVKVYGQQNGKNFYAWIKDFDLGIIEGNTDSEDNQQSANNPQNLTVSINLSGDIARELKAQDFESIANKIINDIFYSCHHIFIDKISISNENCVISKTR